MGEDKRFLLMPNGRSLLRIALDKARKISTTVILSVGSRDRLSNVQGVRVARDDLFDHGPLGGLRVSLAKVTVGKAVVIPCDVPFLAVGLLNHFIHVSGDADIVVPVAGRTQPLTGVYSKRVLPILKENISRGVLSLHGLVQDKRLNVVRIGSEQVRRFGDPRVMFFNVNTPKDMETARQMVEKAVWDY